MATKTITVRVDETIKEQAEVILNEIGITTTALFNACLKALVREKKIPFELVSNEYAFKKMVREKLEESQAVASDPTAKRYTHEEIFEPLTDKY
jgi:addiction module RelB/DinJ family antitoxin